MEENQMSDLRREQIYKIASAFKGKEYTQDSITEYCQQNGMETISVNSLGSYIYGLEFDEAIAEIYPKIIAELAKQIPVPEYTTVSRYDEIKKINDEIYTNICKIIEGTKIESKMFPHVASNLLANIAPLINLAGKTLTDRSSAVLRDLAFKHFGNKYTAEDVAKYLDEHGVKA